MTPQHDPRIEKLLLSIQEQDDREQQKLDVVENARARVEMAECDREAVAIALEGDAVETLRIKRDEITQEHYSRAAPLENRQSSLTFRRMQACAVIQRTKPAMVREATPSSTNSSLTNRPANSAGPGNQGRTYGNREQFVRCEGPHRGTRSGRPVNDTGEAG
jgi:hypothetical protein